MHHIIIGNGITGVSAAQAIRQRDAAARITIISDESPFFYARTALMWIYMRQLTQRDTEPFERWYWKEQRIDLRQGRVTGADTAARTVTLEDGDTLSYHRLLLATRGPDRSHLFISHDIQLICYACDRIAVMLSGLLVEEVPVRSLGQAVHHPYTSSLLAAAGVTDRAAEALPEPPPVRGAPGCPYHGPCPHSTPRCATRRPELQPPPGGIREPRHRLACHVLAPGGQP